MLILFNKPFNVLCQFTGEPGKETLAGFILPLQEGDGSWWDYAMWDYHKPYGTAYAVMTLLRCK